MTDWLRANKMYVLIGVIIIAMSWDLLFFPIRKRKFRKKVLKIIGWNPKKKSKKLMLKKKMKSSLFQILRKQRSSLM